MQSSLFEHPSLIIVAIAIGIIILFIFGIFSLFAKFYRKVEQGYAMIVNTMRSEPDVIFTGRMVYPIIHKAELMDISLKTIEIARTGNEGLICQDNIRADIKVTFFVRVNKTKEDVLRVAQGIGCSRASNQETLEGLFSAKFSEALKTVGKSMDFVELYQARDRFRDEIVRQIGDDLSGYVLSDAAIDYLEQTPIGKPDSNNILDAQGIKKITELTALEHIRTNEFRRDEEKQIKARDVETRKVILEQERDQADAEYKQKREIATVKAREEAEAARVEAEEFTKAELARLQAEQSVSVQQENVTREKEVAENNRKRAVAIEEERVIRARQLEIVDREKEVALQQIDRDRAIEVQKKAIADVIRERVIVERTVAEQEEAIKEVRVVAEADRTKQAIILGAEAEAQDKFVKNVKEAEAGERRAHFKATEEITLAEARLKVAEKAAEAKKREAEGIEAITAAPGLAQAKVLLVSADAKEKQGLVDARVKIAAAEAVEKYGHAEAEALQAKLFAEAEGAEKQGLVAVKVRAADAEAITSVGQAEAEVIGIRFAAEAKGLKEKFDAMAAMSEDTRAHEEFRMKLERAHTETLKAIEAQTGIAREQAEVLGTALSRAKIDIVGGQGDYFERFVNALAVGKGIDGAIRKSNPLKVGLRNHLTGERDLVEDFRGVLGALGNASGSVQNLTVSALLGKVLKDGTDSQKAALQTLLEGFKKD